MYSRNVLVTQLVSAYDDLVKQAIAVGDVMISIQKDGAYDSELFTKKLKSFQTHVLSKLFCRGLKVISRSDRGRLHCHCAVALPCSLDNFNWNAFDEAERWYRLYKSTREPSCLSLYKRFTKMYRDSLPAEVRKLNKTLQVKAKAYGLGHIFCIPVRKNTDAYKWYLVKNVPKVRRKNDKGLHYLTSWGLVKPKGFKVLTHRYQDYRHRLSLFAKGLHLTSDNYSIVLKELLGANWHWKCRNYIKEIAQLPEGLYLPVYFQAEYIELQKTVKQYLLRTDQYVSYSAEYNLIVTRSD